MSVEFPSNDPRAEKEARITAYLLGELPVHDAAALRRMLDEDAELSALHDRLRAVIGFVRDETAFPDQPAGESSPPLRLSEERRQKLLATFKTIIPREFAAPPARRTGFRAFVEIAAVIAILVMLAGLLLPALGTAKYRAKRIGVANNLKQIELAKRMWADDSKASPDAQPTIKDLERYFGGPGSGFPRAVEGETYQIGKLSELPSARGKEGKEITFPGGSSLHEDGIAGRRSSGGRVEGAQEENFMTAGKTPAARPNATTAPPLPTQIVLPPADIVAAGTYIGGINQDVADSVDRRAGGEGLATSSGSGSGSLGPVATGAVLPNDALAGRGTVPRTYGSNNAFEVERWNGEFKTYNAASAGAAATLTIDPGTGLPLPGYAPPPQSSSENLWLGDMPDAGRLLQESRAGEARNGFVFATGGGGTQPGSAAPDSTHGVQDAQKARTLSWYLPNTDNNPAPEPGQLANNNESFSYQLTVPPALSMRSTSIVSRPASAASSSPASQGTGASSLSEDSHQPASKLFVTRNAAISPGFSLDNAIASIRDGRKGKDAERLKTESVEAGDLSRGIPDTSVEAVRRRVYIVPNSSASDTNVIEDQARELTRLFTKDHDEMKLTNVEPTQIIDHASFTELPLTPQDQQKALTGLPAAKPQASAPQDSMAIGDPEWIGLLQKPSGANPQKGPSAPISGKPATFSGTIQLTGLTPPMVQPTPQPLPPTTQTTPSIDAAPTGGGIVVFENSSANNNKVLPAAAPAIVVTNSFNPINLGVVGYIDLSASQVLPAPAPASAVTNSDNERNARRGQAAGRSVAEAKAPAQDKFARTDKTHSGDGVPLLGDMPTVGNVVNMPDLPAAKPQVPAPIPQPEVTTSENAFSTFSLNIADVSFKLAMATLAKGQMPDAAGIRSEEFINAFDYRDPEPAPGAPLAFAWERARDPFAHNRDLLRFSVKTAAAGREAGRPLNLVLLLDKSGSMERTDRVRIIHEALRVLATQLGPQDTLSVVTFARVARLWVDGISGSQAGQVANGLDQLTPEGGTNLEEAMRLAYETARRHYLANGINRVVLLTDGAANLGDVNPESLQRKAEEHRREGIALDCFGVGWEDYNDDLLETLSRTGGGRYGFLNTPEEAADDFAGQLAGALRVAASDVKVQVEFNPQRVTAYRQIGYAKHQLTKEQFRDNTVKAAEIGAAESGNGLYVIQVDPNGSGPIATVRVRYRVPGTEDYSEHEWEVPYTGNALSLESASPAMRLMGVAAAFSEWLAENPYAGEVTSDKLLRLLGSVPETYGADERPRKLEWMIRQAGSLTGK